MIIYELISRYYPIHRCFCQGPLFLYDASLLANPQSLDPHLVARLRPVEVINQTAMPPLEHAHLRLEEVTHPDFDVAARLVDQAFVAFGDIVAQVFEAFLARVEWAGDAPHNDAGALVHVHGDAAVREVSFMALIRFTLIVTILQSCAFSNESHLIAQPSG